MAKEAEIGELNGESAWVWLHERTATVDIDEDYFNIEIDLSTQTIKEIRDWAIEQVGLE